MDLQFWTFERAAGILLLLGDVVLLFGITMFWMRRGIQGGEPKSRAHLLWERGFVMSAVIVTVIGFALLEGTLQNTDGRVLARIGATGYLFAGILGVAAEALDLTGKEQSFYPLVVIYVVLAFLSQAAIGGAVAQSGVIAAWIGWVVIIWNLAGLVVLPIVTPRDIDFPVLNHFAQLLIGIALFVKWP